MSNCSFHSNILSNNAHDYHLGSSINSASNLYLATFTPLGVKCVLRRVNLFDLDLAVYENEAHIVASTSHDNLIKILANFVQDTYLYTVFSYAHHGSVDTLCKPFGLPENLLAIILNDVLQAVDYLHRQSILHRAIKGSHVLIYGTSVEWVKFVLTGLKYSCDMGQSNSLQSYDYPWNTSKILHCLAPEVLEQNTIGYDFKADIYSIGCLSCELANGTVPFDNMQSDEVLFYKLTGDMPRPLDSTCEEMNIFRQYADRLELTLHRRYLEYSKRKFTSQFHEFVSQCCLHSEPSRRWSANELLGHTFIHTNLARTWEDKADLLNRHISHITSNERSKCAALQQ